MARQENSQIDAEKNKKVGKSLRQGYVADGKKGIILGRDHP